MACRNVKTLNYAFSISDLSESSNSFVKCFYCSVSIELIINPLQAKRSVFLQFL